MSSITETLQMGLEQVAPMVRRYRDADQGLLRHFKPSKKATVTRQLYRVPYVRYNGGVQAKTNMNGGVIPDGTGPSIDSFKAGFIDSVLAFQVTQEQIDLSRSSEQSRLNVVTEITTNAFKGALDHDNIDLLGDGSGKLTNAASTGTSTTLTFAATTDTLGTNKLFRGRAVEVWDYLGTTKRANGPYIIQSVNHQTRTVTFTAAPTAMGTTDMLSVANITTYGPSTLLSFSSTWPGDATTADGLTGDSWRHGLAYSNDATSSNYYLLKLKSSYPELVPIYQDLEGEALTFAHAEIQKSLMIQTRDETIMNGVMAAMHTAQQTALKTAVTVISRWNREGTQNMINLTPGDKYNDTFMWGEFTSFAVKAQDKARVDCFNPDTWGTVEGEPTDWYRAPDGGSMFERDRDTNGKGLNSYSLRLKQKFDYVNEDPQAGSYVVGAAVPAGL